MQKPESVVVNFSPGVPAQTFWYHGQIMVGEDPIGPDELDQGDWITAVDSVVSAIEGPLYAIDSYSVCVSRVCASLRMAYENRGNMNEYEYSILRKLGDAIRRLDPSSDVPTFPDD